MIEARTRPSAVPLMVRQVLRRSHQQPENLQPGCNKAHKVSWLLDIASYLESQVLCGLFNIGSWPRMLSRPKWNWLSGNATTQGRKQSWLCSQSAGSEVPVPVAAFKDHAANTDHWKLFWFSRRWWTKLDSWSLLKENPPGTHATGTRRIEISK